MPLNLYASERKRRIYDELCNGANPSEGDFDEATLREGRSKGKPQIGITRFEPDSIIFEYIFPDPNGAAVILTVKLSPPERIVFLPVPKWVVESIWQGDIDGSYHFEGDARQLLKEFESSIEPESNKAWFGPRQAKRRE